MLYWEHITLKKLSYALIVKILFTMVGFVTKQLSCKALNEKYGAKAFKYFYIFSIFLGGIILFCIWGMSPKDL